MILSNIKGITIPEGAVKQIADGAGRVLWKSAPSSIVPGLVIGYTGDYTDQADVVMGDGKTYRLLTITGSGTLTLDKSVKADVWLCAGGNGGRYGGRHGGGGGLFVQSDGMQLDASTVCTIGAGASAVTSSTTGGIGSTTLNDEVVAGTGNFDGLNIVAINLGNVPLAHILVAIIDAEQAHKGVLALVFELEGPLGIGLNLCQRFATVVGQGHLATKIGQSTLDDINFLTVASHHTQGSQHYD